MTEKQICRPAIVTSIIATAVAIYIVGISPIPTPKPEQEIANAAITDLRENGWRESNRSLKKKQSENISIGMSKRLQLKSSHEQSSLWLEVAQIRTRGSVGYGVKQIAKEIDKNADKRKYLTMRLGKDQVLTYQDDQKRYHLMACLNGKESRVTAEDLVEKKMSQINKKTLKTKLTSLLGLEKPIAWECTWIELTSTEDASKKEVIAGWKKINKTLKAIAH